MKISVSSREGSGKEQTNQARGQDRKAPSGSARESEIGRLFQAYFNNKMTLVIFLIQSRNLKPNTALVEGVSRFLDDLYRHMLVGKTQEQYRHVFEWLKSFFQSLPDVSQEQRDKAEQLIRGLYHAMGINLDLAL